MRSDGKSTLLQVADGEGTAVRFLHGVHSSRKIARRLWEDVAFRGMSAGNTPDFQTLSEFRRRHLGGLSGCLPRRVRAPAGYFSEANGVAEFGALGSAARGE